MCWAQTFERARNGRPRLQAKQARAVLVLGRRPRWNRVASGNRHVLAGQTTAAFKRRQITKRVFSESGSVPCNAATEIASSVTAGSLSLSWCRNKRCLFTVWILQRRRSWTGKAKKSRTWRDRTRKTWGDERGFRKQFLKRRSFSNEFSVLIGRKVLSYSNTVDTTYLAWSKPNNKNLTLLKVSKCLFSV